MANWESKIKLFLMKLTKQGYDVSLIKLMRYSKEYNRVYSIYKLSFWHQVEKKKKNGEVKIINVPDTFEFTNAIELIKYMVVKSNERETESIC
jgi:hypothetical protein